MDKENGYLQDRTIIRYDVRQVGGRFVETPVYAEPTYVAEGNEYEDIYVNRSDEIEVQLQSKESMTTRKRGYKGKSIAKAAIILSAAIGVTYGADAASTFVQKQGKIISINEAYKDLTEMPGLVQPMIDTITTLTQLNSAKD